MMEDTSGRELGKNADLEKTRGGEGQDGVVDKIVDQVKCCR